MNDKDIGCAVRLLIERELLDSPPPPKKDDPTLPPGLVAALHAWIGDQGDEARVLVGIKTEQQLTDMVSHVRYEVCRLVDFLHVRNGWFYSLGLPDELAAYAASSTLEAALIHARCIAEFLRHTGRPEDTVTAKDYVESWHWTKGEALAPDLAQIHGRVAHLGLIRRSVQREGEDFTWRSFLETEAVPTLLDGFREFLQALDPERLEQFSQLPQGERINLIALIDDTLGPAT